MIMGYSVDVVCYSPYLSQRDSNEFSPLFNSFNIKPSYINISKLFNKIMQNYVGDTRLSAQNTLTDKGTQCYKQHPLSQPTKCVTMRLIFF
jgi:hypothetical protein